MDPMFQIVERFSLTPKFSHHHSNSSVQSLNRVAVMWEASLKFLRKLKCLVGHGPMDVDTLLMCRGLFILDKHLRR